MIIYPLVSCFFTISNFMHPFRQSRPLPTLRAALSEICNVPLATLDLLKEHCRFWTQTSNQLAAKGVSGGNDRARGMFHRNISQTSRQKDRGKYRKRRTADRHTLRSRRRNGPCDYPAIPARIWQRESTRPASVPSSISGCPVRSWDAGKPLRQAPKLSSRSIGMPVSAAPLMGETAMQNAGLDLIDYSLNWMKPQRPRLLSSSWTWMPASDWFVDLRSSSVPFDPCS